MARLLVARLRAPAQRRRRSAIRRADYHYFLYLMASSSRGKFPPKFNGMIWNTGGDLRTWGAQHWYANLSCYYEAIPAANRWKLMDPMFDMYSGMYDASAHGRAPAVGQPGHLHLRDLVLQRSREAAGRHRGRDAGSLSAAETLGPAVRAASGSTRETKHPHSSRWNWIQSGEWVDGTWVIKDRGSGPYGAGQSHLRHHGEDRYYFWRRYEYTLDREWLRTAPIRCSRARWSFIAITRTSKRATDGKYHIHHVNSNESVYGARDTDEDLSVDARRDRPRCCAPGDPRRGRLRCARVARISRRTLRRSRHRDDPEALKPADYSGPRVFVRGLKPAVKDGGFLPGCEQPADVVLRPLQCGGARSPDSRDRAATPSLRRFGTASRPQTPVSVLSKLAIAAASLGRADAVRAPDSRTRSGH